MSAKVAGTVAECVAGGAVQVMRDIVCRKLNEARYKSVTFLIGNSVTEV